MKNNYNFGQKKIRLLGEVSTAIKKLKLLIDNSPQNP